MIPKAPRKRKDTALLIPSHNNPGSTLARRSLTSTARSGKLGEARLESSGAKSQEHSKSPAIVFVRCEWLTTTSIVVRGSRTFQRWNLLNNFFRQLGSSAGAIQKQSSS